MTIQHILTFTKYVLSNPTTIKNHLFNFNRLQELLPVSGLEQIKWTGTYLLPFIMCQKSATCHVHGMKGSTGRTSAQRGCLANDFMPPTALTTILRIWLVCGTRPSSFTSAAVYLYCQKRCRNRPNSLPTQNTWYCKNQKPQKNNSTHDSIPQLLITSLLTEKYLTACYYRKLRPLSSKSSYLMVWVWGPSI